MNSRVTNSMLTKHFLTNLHKDMARMDKQQYQLATNRKIVTISDDPVGVVKSMQVRSKLYRVEQYQRNLTDAQNWLAQAESTLQNVNDFLKSAYENVIDAANDTKSAEDKSAIAVYIMQLRDHTLQLANTSVNGQYIFGGFNTTTPPFSPNGDGTWSYNGIDFDSGSLDDECEQTIQFEVGLGTYADVSYPGPLVFKLDPNSDESLYTILHDLAQTLNADGTNEDIEKYIAKIQGMQQHVLSVLADIGGRTNRLDAIAERYSLEDINYTKIKSDVEDVDQAEVIMNYKMAESVYRSALSAGAQIIQPTLMDYLRR